MNVAEARANVGNELPRVASRNDLERPSLRMHPAATHGPIVRF